MILVITRLLLGKQGGCKSTFFSIYDDLTCVNLIQFNQLQYPPSDSRTLTWIGIKSTSFLRVSGDYTVV